MNINIENADLANFMAADNMEDDPLLSAHLKNVTEVREERSAKDSKKFKAIIDFKARVLDFISIYIKERGN
jgi:hypothetical protein